VRSRARILSSFLLQRESYKLECCELSSNFLLFMSYDRDR
jgi:hypothetical protein